MKHQHIWSEQKPERANLVATLFHNITADSQHCHTTLVRLHVCMVLARTMYRNYCSSKIIPLSSRKYKVQSEEKTGKTLLKPRRERNIKEIT